MGSALNSFPPCGSSIDSTSFKQHEDFEPRDAANYDDNAPEVPVLTFVATFTWAQNSRFTPANSFCSALGLKEYDQSNRMRSMRPSVKRKSTRITLNSKTAKVAHVSPPFTNSQSPGFVAAKP